ncbi:exonuclease [Gordonia phage Trine]|uniref:Cas4 family exonuclease n=1 Tax=Gordonia phage Trine TaxID=2201431 RepID=A0A2Z4Q8X3_9CAUD|nr:exonuclease [Gordonia phage Trine]AWY06532.1 hypothetical protein PBI_TRINE_30 [Gordonia phage Trine]
MTMFASPTGPEAASPFASPEGQVNETPVHKLPLPPETRDYRPRYNYRRQYVLPDVEGKSLEAAYTRVTTGAKTLDDTAGLERWKIRSIVRGLRDNPHLLEDIDVYQEPREVNKELDRVADLAHEANGGAFASELGTAIHAWTEAVELGQVTASEVPAQFRGHVNAYLEAMAKWGITTPVDPSGRPYVERIVYNPTTEWVGTFDRIYQLADGSWAIGDVKTTKDYTYAALAISIQLGDYADSTLILSTDGQHWEPMPEVRKDLAVMAWVPSNATPPKAEMVSINLEAGRYAIEAALAVREMRAQAKNIIPNVLPLPRPEEASSTPAAKTPAGGDLEAARAALRGLIRTCSTAEQLADVYDQYAEIWTEELTALGREVLSRKEAAS